jgi:hypothetical protein
VQLSGCHTEFYIAKSYVVAITFIPVLQSSAHNSRADMLPTFVESIVVLAKVAIVYLYV